MKSPSQQIRIDEICNRYDVPHGFAHALVARVIPLLDVARAIHAKLPESDPQRATLGTALAEFEDGVWHITL